LPVCGCQSKKKKNIRRLDHFSRGPWAVAADQPSMPSAAQRPRFRINQPEAAWHSLQWTPPKAHPYRADPLQRHKMGRLPAAFRWKGSRSLEPHPRTTSNDLEHLPGSDTLSHQPSSYLRKGICVLPSLTHHPTCRVIRFDSATTGDHRRRGNSSQPPHEFLPTLIDWMCPRCCDVHQMGGRAPLLAPRHC
jgi:hypothetical protein